MSVREKSPRVLARDGGGPTPPSLGPYALGRVHQVDSLAALRELPDASVDMLLTDPPYSSGGFTRGDRNRDPREKYADDESPFHTRISFTGDNRDGRSWAYWMALWLSEVRRIVKPGGYALVFCDWRQLPLATDSFQAGGLVWRGLVSWDKGPASRAPHTGYFRHQCEYVVWGSNGALDSSGHGGPWPGSISCPIDRKDKHHLTGKPVELLRTLVRVAPPGGLVLDPFAGSGTTLVACSLEGRRGLGFELEAENVRISNRRIEGAAQGLSGREALEGQASLFKEGGT